MRCMACLAHLIGRARALSEQKEPELPWFGGRTMAELQRLAHWATAPPTRGEVQTWYARMGHLLRPYRPCQDAVGTFARMLERKLGALSKRSPATSTASTPTSPRSEDSYPPERLPLRYLP